MTNTEHSTVGVFDTLQQAESSVNELQRAGFAADEIGIVGNMGPEQRNAAAIVAKAPEYNVIDGVVAGGIMGAVVGVVVLLAIPGIGAVSGFGQWFELLGGLLLGAAAGGVMFAFGSLFLFRRRNRLVAQEVAKGRYVITVRSAHRQQEAANVLRRSGSYVENTTNGPV